MENKKTGIIIAVVAVILFVGVAFVFVNKSQNVETVKNSTTNEDTTQLTKIQEKYYEVQNQMASDLPCGVVDFESPDTKPIKCAPEKMKKGDEKLIRVKGTITTETGSALPGARVLLNNKTEVYADDIGDFDTQVSVDSNKPIITVIAEKDGYSPAYFVANAQNINELSDKIEILSELYLTVFMQPGEIRNDIVLYKDKDTKIVSQKYPWLSLIIPAGGLQDKDGNIVLGNVKLVLNSIDATDEKNDMFIPGFEGNGRQMVAVNDQGEQIIVGAVDNIPFFHFTKQGDEDGYILQPRENVPVIMTQTMDKLKESKNIILDDSLQESNTEQDVFSSYWFYNNKTGIWEEWHTNDVVFNESENSYSVEIPRFY
jgi:hypothetical protein